MDQPLHMEKFLVSSWYEQFKEHTFVTRIIKPLPSSFIDFLQGSAILGDEPGTVMPSECFPEVEYALQDCLTNFEPAGMSIKLCWNSPKDTVWLSFDRNQRCSTTHHVYSFLKSS